MNSNRTTNVLIVDDEQQLLESYAAMLETRYEVSTAESGEAALEAVDMETDVVLLDRRMPEYTGTELLPEIRARAPDCRVLFCSAVVPSAEILAVEPDGYLHKPVGMDGLIDAVETQLEEANQPSEVQEYLRLERLKTILEDNQPRSQLTSTTAYQELLDKLEQKARAIENSQHTAPAV